MPDVTLGPYRIPAAVVDANKDSFLATFPVPLDEEGEPIMGQLAWFNEFLRRQMVALLARCRQAYAKDQIHYEPDDGDVV